MAFVIQVNGLSKSFGRAKVLDNLSFSIPENSIAGFLGPNGAGKTTAMRLMLGLIPPKQGKIELLGCKLPKEHVKALEQVGAVVENPTFIETMTAHENLYWFGSLYKPVKKNRIEEVIEMVGLKDAKKKPFGAFSSGMKQRLGVAFGLLHKPKLLILDEPTSGMDPTGRVQMRQILKNIHEEQKASIFLSSHLLDEVQRLCDYAVIIDKGRTIKEGYVKDLLSSHREEWEFRIPDEDNERAAEIIKQALGADTALSHTPQGIVVIINDGASASLNAELIKQGIRVKAVIPHEHTLEETFIKLTSDAEKGT